MRKSSTVKICAISAYILFIAVSVMNGFVPGKEIAVNFYKFTVEMLRVLPCGFILIGLFEVWVKRETVEKHFGQRSSFRGHIWAVLLAGTTVGGLYVAFPLAYSLHNKGAKLSIIFTYIGASAICRVPMTIFEASFMGLKFTAIRLLISLPLLIVTSILLGNYLAKRNYTISKGK